MDQINVMAQLSGRPDLIVRSPPSVLNFCKLEISKSPMLIVRTSRKGCNLPTFIVYTRKGRRMPFTACRRKHSTFSYLSASGRFVSKRPFSVAAHQFDANSESPPHRVVTPTRENGQTFQGPSISGTLFADGRKSGSFKQGDSTFYSIIEANAESGDIRSLEMVFQLMKRERRSFIEKNFILFFRACGKAQLPLKAVEFFDRMVDEFHCKQTVRSLNCVLNVIIHHSLYRHALEFYDHVVGNRKNVSPNVLTFNLIIKALCRLGLVGRALHMFREMALLQLDPDAYTYCTLMDGLCKEDRIDDAMALLDEMHLDGCYPTPATFNVLINGLCRKGDLARAAKLVDNMFLKGCIPTVVTYNTLIHGLSLKGKLGKAVSLLAQMLSNKLIPTDVTYGTMINGLVKQGRADEAVNVLTEMEERGYKMNEYAYSALISGLFKEGNSEEALNVWGKMIEKGPKPNTVVYSALINGLCREGRPSDAEEYLLQMIDKGCRPTAFTYSSLLRGLFQAGNSDKALLLWKEMAEKDDLFCCSVLIDGLCKDGRLRDALMVWKHMIAKGLAPDTVAYSSMIHGFCTAGSINQGLNLFNDMLCQANAKPDVITYNILFSALCKQGQISHAIDLLNSMLNRGCDPDAVTCKIFLTTFREKLDPSQDGREFLDVLALRLKKRGRIFGASKILEIMLENFLHPKASTWKEIIQEICKHKRSLAAIDKCWGELFR